MNTYTRCTAVLPSPAHDSARRGTITAGLFVDNAQEVAHDRGSSNRRQDRSQQPDTQDPAGKEAREPGPRSAECNDLEAAGSAIASNWTFGPKKIKHAEWTAALLSKAHRHCAELTARSDGDGSGNR